MYQLDYDRVNSAARPDVVSLGRDGRATLIGKSPDAPIKKIVGAAPE